MVYCTHCADYCPSIKDPDKGYICCGLCGKVLDEEVYTDEPNFIKDPTGQSHLAGKILSSIESGYTMSRERTLQKGRDEISQIISNLHVGGGDTIINKAHKFYQLAVEQNFTRGRRSTHVAAACLYIACRQSKKAYLLIDFSDYLRISVYVLGAVFLQLCQVLLLSNHPFVQKLIDPSLFIHRFTERLLRRRDNEVSETALRILASMKRDWMQTGRKPSGLCGAALYIAALSHGYDYTKADIVSVVHVCEATLTKRLIEFENTDSGTLTIEEFLAKADEVSEEPVPKHSPKSGEILCKHKCKGAEHFAHGLCKKCYNKFTELSGGLDGGCDPPAFQRAEKQRLEAEKTFDEATSIKEAESISDTQNSDVENICKPPIKDKSGDENFPCTSAEITNVTILSKDPEGEKCKGDDDPESLSDIDDLEVDWYLHNEEEKQYKKVIWEEMNKEYLEEQAAKEALAAELAARGVGMEDGKKKRRKRNEDAKASSPAETPAEATYNMLKRKGLRSNINVEAVGGLYNTKDEDDSGSKKEEMDYDGEYTRDDNGDVDHDYDYADHNYDNDGGEADDIFDFL